jgi:pimeloyl-ACP methyl ester carboxylesterase
MFDFLDLLLLRRGLPSDDRTLAFRRIDGTAQAPVIYFLPWHTPYKFARQAGFTPLDFLACYEMPPAIVSSEPELSVKAMHALVSDAEAVLSRHAISLADVLIVGLSVGTFPATYLANRLGARLCAVASADRADLMVWQSPAARLIKRRAIQKGFRLADYAKAMRGCHPAHNLAGIHRKSLFVLGSRDPFIPPRRKAGLLEAIETHAPRAQVVTLDAGHFRTLMASGGYQRAMLGILPGRRSWQIRLPFQRSGRAPAPESAMAATVALRPLRSPLEV